ncbi:cell division-specific peptidoglycan biosynthesis regulator FtsW [Brevibacterium jeotgali]|uniref:Probable peptidoglycan glycosyltransferase FtsW n=1 Tax=Brevibacterium jeotgali TaxID=1262550 RepID=A0A2H1L6R4_9MICO|nr:cell division-specific peptidoglycan biosynthesis regulator FtsW [Brevibacterium jeotgali]
MSRGAVVGERTTADGAGEGRADGPSRLGPVAGLKHALSLPATSFVLVLVSVLALTGFGLIMVLSASSITAYDGGEGSSFGIVARQAAFAVVGLAMMLVLSRLGPRWWRPLAWVAFVLALLLQAATLTPLGVEVNGSQSWIKVGGGMRVQPAEFVKVAFALWLGAVLSHEAVRTHALRTWGTAVGGLAAAGGLIMLGHDLGTAMMVFLLFMGALFVSDLPIVASFGTAAAGAGAVALFVLSSPNRLRRIAASLGGRDDASQVDLLGAHWQSAHGEYALASGGIFGVGLGASREKWSWLPEAHNDFIFAIIGEELGLVGSLLVVGLFILLGWGLLRVSLRAADPLMRITSMAVFMWIIGQAAVNVAVVIQLLPVIGVPLPYVSYGGSALIANLIAAGLVLAFARQEPGAADALAWRRSRRRPLSILARRSGGRP